MLLSGIEDRYILVCTAGRLGPALFIERLRIAVSSIDEHSELVDMLAPLAQRRNQFSTSRFFLTSDGCVIAQIKEFVKPVFIGKYKKPLEFMFRDRRISPIAERNIPISEVGKEWCGPVSGHALQVASAGDDVLAMDMTMALSQFLVNQSDVRQTVEQLVQLGVQPGQAFLLNEHSCVLASERFRRWRYLGTLNEAVQWFPKWEPKKALRGTIGRAD